MASYRWAAGQSGNFFDPSRWQPHGVPGQTDSTTIDAAGSYVVEIGGQTFGAFLGDLVLNDAGATIAATETLFPHVLTLEQGVLNLGSQTIAGGTLIGVGGLVAGSTTPFPGTSFPATLAGVDIRGTLALAAGAWIETEIDLSVTGLDGIGSGVVDLTRPDTMLTVQGFSQTIDHVLIDLGSNDFNAPATLSFTGTLGSDGTVIATGTDGDITGSIFSRGTIMANAGRSIYAFGTITNDGSIETDSGGQFSVGNLINDAIVTVGQYGSLRLGTLTNDATLTVENGGTLYVRSIASVGMLTLDDGATIALQNAGASQTITLGHHDALALGALTFDGTTYSSPNNIQATIAGFDRTDAIVVGNQVDSVVYTPGSVSNAGTLTLGAKGVQIAALTLAGDFAGQTFVAVPYGTGPGGDFSTAIVLASQPSGLGPSAGTHGGQDFTWTGPEGADWQVAANWIANSPVSVAPGSNDRVTLPYARAGSQIIGGLGQASTVTAQGGQVLLGRIVADALSIAPPANAGSRVAYVQVDPGGSVTANRATLADNSSLRLDGGTVTVSGAVVASGDNGDVSLIGGSRVHFSALDAAGFSFGVGKSSSVEIGNAGNAALGALTIDDGVSVKVTNTVSGFAPINSIAPIPNSNYFLATGTLVDDGTISVTSTTSIEYLITDGGSLDPDYLTPLPEYAPTVLTGSGKIVIAANSTVDVSQAPVTGGLTFTLGDNNTLALGAAAGTVALGAHDTIVIRGDSFDPTTGIYAAAYAMNAALTGFGIGDTLTIDHPADRATFAPEAGEHSGVLTISDVGTVVATVTLDGDYVGRTFSIAPTTLPLTYYNQGTVTAAAITLACFAAGTRMLTPEGMVPVENIGVGERLVTASGEVRHVVWTGRRQIDCARHPDPSAVSPIRIRANAVAPGVPARDVLLSPDHAVRIDDHLIEARRLLNGNSVVREPATVVTYHHVQLATHDILLAEGLPAESYRDTGHAAFANFPARNRAEPPCLPIATDTEASRLWRRLATRPRAMTPDGSSPGASGERDRGLQISPTSLPRRQPLSPWHD